MENQTPKSPSESPQAWVPKTPREWLQHYRDEWAKKQVAFTLDTFFKRQRIEELRKNGVNTTARQGEQGYDERGNEISDYGNVVPMDENLGIKQTAVYNSIQFLAIIDELLGKSDEELLKVWNEEGLKELLKPIEPMQTVEQALNQK